MAIARADERHNDPELPRVDSKFSKRVGKAESVEPLIAASIAYVVELGQLCIAAIVLPILWNLRRNPSFVRRWVPGCSLAVAFAGSYWMVERVMQR